MERDCDVLVCGASFAGLAVARELRGSGARVLLIDRYELGERQTSACAMPTVWMQALGAMTGRRARNMIPVIADLLKKEEVVEVQQEALLALGRIGSADAVTILKEWAAPGGRLLKRRPVPTRLAAIQALGMTGPGAIEALNALAKDEVAEVREAATIALHALRA